jgi:hypothetical protein
MSKSASRPGAVVKTAPKSRRSGFFCFSRFLDANRVPLRLKTLYKRGDLFSSEVSPIHGD